MSSTATRTALEPLRALRYDQSKVDLAEVIAPPYDIVTEPQRDSLIRRCQYCVVRLELPESPQTAATLLHEWERDGVLARDERPALWWHEQTFTGPDGVDRVRKGFFAALRLSPYDVHVFYSYAIRALASYAAGDYADTVQWARRSNALNPRFTANLRFLAASLAATGQVEEAGRAAGQLLHVNPDFSVRRFAEGHAFKDPVVRTRFAEQLIQAGLPK